MSTSEPTPPVPEQEGSGSHDTAAQELSELLGYSEKSSGEEKGAPRKPLAAPVFARLLLGLVGLIWLAVGASALFQPDAFGAAVDFDLETATARYEVRAHYGGLSLVLGFLHVLAIFRRHLLQPMLLLGAALMLGLAGGRVGSLFLDEPPSFIGFVFLAVEVVGFAAMLVAVHRLRKSERSAASQGAGAPSGPA